MYPSGDDTTSLEKLVNIELNPYLPRLFFLLTA